MTDLPDIHGVCPPRFAAVKDAFADPAARVAAAYVMTRQSPHLIGDPRAIRLQQALYSAF